MYKITFFSIVFTLFISLNCISQESNPIILTEPLDWRYEKIDFPLDFAPDIPYKGFEELRFAPGMFDTASPTYFTYVFAIVVNNKTTFKKKELEQFLSKYYKGLCEAVAKSKKETIDVSKIKVTLKRSRKKETYKSKKYTAEVLFFDTFNSGEKVVLRMEMEITKNKKTNTSHILALVSPKQSGTDIWKELHRIRDKARPKISMKR